MMNVQKRILLTRLGIFYHAAWLSRGRHGLLRFANTLFVSGLSFAAGALIAEGMVSLLFDCALITTAGWLGLRMLDPRQHENRA